MDRKYSVERGVIMLGILGCVSLSHNVRLDSVRCTDRGLFCSHGGVAGGVGQPLGVHSLQSMD